MGLGRVVATAAAATPLIQDSFRRHSSHAQEDYDGLEEHGGSPILAAAPHLPPQPVSQTLHGRDPESLAGNPSLIVVTDEMARRPLLVDVHASRQSPGTSQGYGSVSNEVGPYSLRASPERYRSSPCLDRVPEDEALVSGNGEDEEEDDEWDLEEQGYYSGEFGPVLDLF